MAMQGLEFITTITTIGSLWIEIAGALASGFRMSRGGF